MSIIHNYCITGKNYNFLNNLKLNVIVSGSNNKNLELYPSNWYKDNEGINISEKNKNYGTLTSHYWFWKNKLKDHDDNAWIGFNHYRRFWVKNFDVDKVNLANLSENILREVIEQENCNVFLPNKISLPKIKLSKLLKKGFRNYIRNPNLLFYRKAMTIKFHFDIFHKYQIIEKATKLLNIDDREDFLKYINLKTEFYPLQMFISKKKIINPLYRKTFDWIFKCEEKFSNLKLEGYGKERLYDFLAERFFSFYFEKYAKIKIMPYILLKDNLK
tara:strand:+ start:993 stop:1811 length:819 start_codon:yes stop_codon:yes gene_type:complete